MYAMQRVTCILLSLVISDNQLVASTLRKDRRLTRISFIPATEVARIVAVDLYAHVIFCAMDHTSNRF